MPRKIWLGTLLLLGFLSVARLSRGARDLINIDTWFALSRGQAILRDGFDVFAAAQDVVVGQGQTWVNTQWLSNVMMHALYVEGGMRALVAMRLGLLVAALALVVWELSRQRYFGRGLVVAGYMAIVYMDSAGFFVRSQAFTEPVFVAILLLRHDVARRARVLECVLLVLWLNLHGSGLLGVALSHVFAVGRWWRGSRDYRTEVVAAFARTFALMMTPLGWQTITAILQQGASDRRNVSEWLSPYAHQEWQAVLCACAILAFAVASFRKGRWREELADRVVLALLSLMMLQAIRFSFFLAWAGAVLLPGLVSGTRLTFDGPKAFGQLTAVLGIAMTVHWAAAIRFVPAQVRADFPPWVVDHVRALPSGTVVCSLHGDCDWLAYEIGTHHRYYSDIRFMLHSQAVRRFSNDVAHLRFDAARANIVVFDEKGCIENVPKLVHVPGFVWTAHGSPFYVAAGVSHGS